MMIKILKFILTLIISLEILSHLVGYQADGKVFILGSYPYGKTKTLSEWKEIYKKLEADTLNYYQYDSITGWSNRPNSVSSNGYYHINSQGIRGVRNYSENVNKDTIRILLLGNSAVFSAEVSDTNTFGFYLEQSLKAADKKVEVLNMGVGSFGNDQTLLHWKYKAKTFEPDIVIQGVHYWDFWINLNIYKYCAFPATGIFYTKPRAIIAADSFQFVNFPTLPVAQIIDSIILDYEHRDFYEYEYFKDRKRHGVNILENSFIYQFLNQGIKDINNDVDNVPEGKQLMSKLVNDLQADVENTGAKYVMLQLTAFDDFIASDLTSHYRNEAFWESITAEKNVFSTLQLLLNHKDKTPFVPSQMHYSANGNRIIGDALANYLIKNNMLVKKAKSKD